MTPELSRIKLISLNIEMNRHIDAISSFLEREQPDVICLQELLERDVSHFEKLLAMKGEFVPMATLDYPGFDAEVQGLPFGNAIFSRFKGVHAVDYYSGNSASLPKGILGGEGNKTLLRNTFTVGGKAFTIGVTHFTWTQDGEANEAQRRDVKALLATLKKVSDIVFCGDFNAPRGREIWEHIAAQYHDNIPKQYISSLDPKLHRAGHLQYVVDGLFSTPEYRVSDVRLVEDVSDHKVVVGFIERVS